MVPQVYQPWAAGALVAGGLVACFAGYRFFRIVLAIYGCILGALVATSLAGGSSREALLVAAGVGGLAGALLLYFGYFAGVALVGAGLGALVAHVAWSAIGTEPPAWAVVLMSVAGAFGAMALQRYVIVAGTAVAGAWTAVVGAMALAGDSTALAAAERGAVWVVYPLDPAPGQRWVLVAWIGLVVAGLATQLMTRGRTRKSTKK
jgi:hypothetical protein